MAVPARTTIVAVKNILAPGKDYDDRREPTLTGFVATASAIVDRVVACAAADGVTLNSIEQELIERWLAAHYYKCSDRQYASKNTAGAGASFTGQYAMGLKATLYGQCAMDLDPSGCLAALVDHAVASADWLGKTPTEQTAYEDRR